VPLAPSLSPDVVMGIQAQAAKIQRSTETTPLDLGRLRDDTAQLQALIAEATSLVRRALAKVADRSQPAVQSSPPPNRSKNRKCGAEGHERVRALAPTGVRCVGLPMIPALAL
jgi:hypothetical protein